MKSSKEGAVFAVLGSQWGDEGKGKLVDVLASDRDVVVRANGGANAGHTVYVPSVGEGERKYEKHVFHLLPSGIIQPHTTCVIGNGCVVHVPTMLEEMSVLEKKGIDIQDRLFVSDRAHLVFEYHKFIDRRLEEMKGKSSIGTTMRGIGPAYTDKISRVGITFGEFLDFDLFKKHLESNAALLGSMYGMDVDVSKEISYFEGVRDKIYPLIKNTTYLLDGAVEEGKKILIEGANGTLLDVDHGTYPFVTSSNPSIGGVIAGSGIGANKIDSVVGVMKAYFTRVGSGPFPTELNDEVGEKLRALGGEYGATTGRPRRCGWFDAVASKYSRIVNGLDTLNITKLDVLDSFDSVRIGVAYKINGVLTDEFPSSINALENAEVVYEDMPGWETSTAEVRKISDLPYNARQYVERLETLVGASVEYVGVGVERDAIAVK